MLTNNLLNFNRIWLLFFFNQLNPIISQSPNLHQVLFPLILITKPFPDHELVVDIDFVPVHVVFEGRGLLGYAFYGAFDKE